MRRLAASWVSWVAGEDEDAVGLADALEAGGLEGVVEKPARKVALGPSTLDHHEGQRVHLLGRTSLGPLHFAAATFLHVNDFIDVEATVTPCCRRCNFASTRACCT